MCGSWERRAAGYLGKWDRIIRRAYDRKHQQALAANRGDAYKAGRHFDGGGLHAFVSRDGGAIRRRWILRFKRRGANKEMGLGPPAEISLKETRELRGRWRRRS
jgi:hypothetical protein